MTADVLIFGAHPDDVECGVGGIALRLKGAGVSFGIVDLTRGEMGSRGTVEERLAEAAEAARYMGASFRENLDLGDARLVDTVETRQQCAAAIRRHRPTLVLAPFWEDLHNDHAAAGLIVRHSALYCSMAKAPIVDAPHKPRAFLYYPLHAQRAPTFVVDVTSVFDGKVEAIRLHRSQFDRNAEEYGILPVGIGEYLFHLESRSRYFGSLVNVRFGEALLSEQPYRLDDVSWLLR